MVTGPILALLTVFAAIHSPAQDSVLYGSHRGWKVWCDPVRDPMIVEVSGPKFGALDTLDAFGQGRWGTLSKAGPMCSAWTYTSTVLDVNIRLGTAMLTTRQMHRRRYVYGMAAHGLISELKQQHAFPEYTMSMDLDADFDDFVHRRPGSPGYMRDFQKAVASRKQPAE